MGLKRILIIEDNLDFSEQLAEALESEGYSTDQCANAHQGEDLIRNGGHDIVLLDYKMPECTGGEILKRLKQDGIRKTVFLITGKPFIEDILDAEDLSDMVAGVLGKPVNFKSFLRRWKRAFPVKQMERESR